MRLTAWQVVSEKEKECQRILSDFIQGAENKSELKDLAVVGVKELNLVTSKKRAKNVVLIYVPYPSLKVAQRNHAKLVAEFEKKLKCFVFLVAKRTIASRWIKSHRSQVRPRSRTLTAVYDAILDDLIFPCTKTLDFL